MMKEKQVAAAAASLIQVIGWVSNVGFLVAIVGGIIGINSTYRFGSFVFSTVSVMPRPHGQ
jgi:hypothetical protein